LDPTVGEMYGSSDGLWYKYNRLRMALGDWNQSLWNCMHGTGANYSPLPNWHDLPGFTPSEWRTPPDRTIVVPVELMSTSWETLEQFLRILQRGCRNLGRTEVLIWFNTYFDPDGDWNIIPNAMRDFDIMLAELGNSDIPSRDFRLRVVHRFRISKDSSEGAFNEIRSAYMDVLVWQARPRHYPYMHPVWWMDLDTPFMSRALIRVCEYALKEKRGHFIKANLQCVGGNPWAGPLTERSKAEKVASVFAVARRKLERNLTPTDSRGYVEESGLLLAFGKYMRSGGVGVCNPLLGESRTMLERAARVLDPSIPLVYYVKSARMGFDYRNWVLEATWRQAWELPGLEEGDGYLDYTAKAAKGIPPARTDAAAAGEIRTMIQRLETIQIERSGIGLTEPQRRQLELLITRLGFADSASLATIA